jgi:hypothetical protein
MRARCHLTRKLGVIRDWVVNFGPDPGSRQGITKTGTIATSNYEQMGHVAPVVPLRKAKRESAQTMEVLGCDRSTMFIPEIDKGKLDAQKSRLDLVQPAVSPANAPNVVF